MLEDGINEQTSVIACKTIFLVIIHKFHLMKKSGQLFGFTCLFIFIINWYFYYKLQCTYLIILKNIIIIKSINKVIVLNLSVESTYR